MGEPRPVKIAITGRLGRGKDTIADMFMRLVPETHLTTRIAIADALKWEVAVMTHRHVGPAENLEQWYVRLRQDKELNGLSYQWWGEWRRRHCGIDYWLNHTQFVTRYNHATREMHNVVITDVRHLNEGLWAKQHDFFLVRIDGPCRVSSNRNRDHESERDVEKIPVHAVIRNGNDRTLDALYTAVCKLYNLQIAPFFGAL